METEISERINKAISDKVFPGCSVGYIKNDSSSVLSFGHLTYDANAREVDRETIYDIASVTKVIPTSSLLLKFIDEGKASLSDKVVDFIPEFANDTVTLKHLLTYTLDLDIPRMSALKNETPETILKTLLTLPMKSEPGTKFVYTNTTGALIGLVAEKIGDKTLPELASEQFFDPLKMDRTTFSPKKFGLDNIAPTEFDDWRGRLVHGEVHDESAWAMGKKMAVGSAGVFSTASDLLKFLEMLLAQGVKDGNRYFSEQTIKAMYTNQLADMGIKGFAGLGWELNQPWFMGDRDPEHIFGKTGFTGCVVMVNIPQQAALVLLSNRTYPKRPSNNEAINKVRADIASLIFR